MTGFPELPDSCHTGSRDGQNMKTKSGFCETELAMSSAVVARFVYSCQPLVAVFMLFCSPEIQYQIT